DIPKLCATDSLKQFGSRRLCLIEIEGGRGNPASCTTPCGEGMVVRTTSPPVDRLRKGVMELYLTDHPADCSACAQGDCEIVEQARRAGVETARYAPGENHLEAPVDCSNPYFDFDP